jgi:predicted transcriptional regulator
MVDYSSAQVAKKLGITPAALSKYIKAKKVPSPRTVQVGKMKLQAWTEAEIEHVRKLLPRIANGRKTRYQKLREKQKAQAKPVPRKTKKK